MRGRSRRELKRGGTVSPVPFVWLNSLRIHSTTVIPPSGRSPRSRFAGQLLVEPCADDRFSRADRIFPFADMPREKIPYRHWRADRRGGDLSGSERGASNTHFHCGSGARRLIAPNGAVWADRENAGIAPHAVLGFFEWRDLLCWTLIRRGEGFGERSRRMEKRDGDYRRVPARSARAILILGIPGFVVSRARELTMHNRFQRSLP